MTILSSDTDWERALAHCADEPLHLIGQVQGGALLIGIDTAADRFTYLSANAGTLLGHSVFELWSLAPTSLFGAEQVGLLARRSRSWKGRGPRLLNIEFPAGAFYPGWVHLIGQNLVIEAAPASDDSHLPLEDVDDWDEAVRESLNKVEACVTLEEKIEAVVNETADLSGFDRVMVYRFLPDGTGEVIAEKVREDWEPFLGLRYPYSDIPLQARELFMKNDIRLISDVAAEPVPLLANPALAATGSTLDLSLGRFRQPAAVHLLYLTNMGVAASFVSAIIIDGSLWGLISCHHGTSLYLSAARQARLSALTNHLSVVLAGMARESRLRHELAGARIASKLIQCVAVTDNWASVLLTMADELCEMMKADGLSLVFDGSYHSHGLTPDENTIGTLAHLAMENGDGKPYPFRRTNKDQGPSELPPNIGGYLAIPLSYFRNDSLLFFRKEQTAKILWAGNPEKNIDWSQGVPRLHPRSSFAKWQETVKGTCEEWTAEEVSWATTIGSTLSDIVITSHYFRQAMESSATARHRLAHEGDSDPVALADENGIIVYQNPAALADPILLDLHSLDHLADRFSGTQAADILNLLRDLAHGGDDIRLPLEISADPERRTLVANRLAEGDQLIGYLIKLSR